MGGGEGNRGPQTDKHLPPSTCTGQFLRNKRKLKYFIFFLIISGILAAALVAGKKK
jgi:hypothetical protein